jgi:hypothetical protein
VLLRRYPPLPLAERTRLPGHWCGRLGAQTGPAGSSVLCHSGESLSDVVGEHAVAGDSAALIAVWAHPWEPDRALRSACCASRTVFRRSLRIATSHPARLASWHPMGARTKGRMVFRRCTAAAQARLYSLCRVRLVAVARVGSSPLAPLCRSSGSLTRQRAMLSARSCTRTQRATICKCGFTSRRLKSRYASGDDVQRGPGTA